jgi:hypothetical protein
MWAVEPDILQVLSVTHEPSGNHFRNIYCSLCYGLTPSEEREEVTTLRF